MHVGSDKSSQNGSVSFQQYSFQRSRARESITLRSRTDTERRTVIVILDCAPRTAAALACTHGATATAPATANFANANFTGDRMGLRSAQRHAEHDATGPVADRLPGSGPTAGVILRLYLTAIPGISDRHFSVLKCRSGGGGEHRWARSSGMPPGKVCVDDVAIQVCEARNDRDRGVRSPAACLPSVGWTVSRDTGRTRRLE